MSGAGKQLSSAASTGGAGGHFEAHVQASFVTLMLTGGHAPCLPCWPITEIKLQGKVDGFNTDDLIVFVEKQASDQKRKLLGQVKRSIKFTKGNNNNLTEVLQAAWDDFNNPSLFSKNRDVIALITGHLNATDANNVVWLLDYAKHTKTSTEFFQNATKAKFSPAKSEEKLNVFRHHLQIANNCTALSDEELYSFLNHFFLVGYDLGKETGVVLSLLCSHISQFDIDVPEWVWARIVEIVQCWNQNAGTITQENLPEDLKNAFKAREAEKIPADYVRPKAPINIGNVNISEQATALAVASLLGKWNEGNEDDLEIIRRLADGF
jgi:hypothetical protein